MVFKFRSALCQVFWGAALALLHTVASAQAWPTRPIKVIVPYPPGGPSDIVLRLAADKLRDILGQPIVVDNQPGAGGNIGSATAARAAPDGYTWLIATDSVMTVNPHVYKTMPFKLEDFKPVTLISSFSQTLVCNPAVGVKTLPELIAKAKTSSMSYASGGPGVPGHLSMELLLSMSGMAMTHIPYKGPAPATQDVLAGQVECGLLAGPTVLPHVRSGRLVALAVSGQNRSPTLPEVPTIAEAGLPGYQLASWYALFAPSMVSEDIVTLLQKAVVKGLSGSIVRQDFALLGADPLASSPQDLANIVQQDLKKWLQVAKEAGIKAQ